MFGGIKRQREPQGCGNPVFDNTTVLLVAPGLDPPVHIDWPGQQLIEDSSDIYPSGLSTEQQLKRVSLYPAAAAAAAMASSYVSYGYQQPLSAADVSTGSTMLYGRYRHDHALIADSLHDNSSEFARPQMQRSLAADQACKAYSQHQMLQSQHQEVAGAAKAQQQHQLLLIEAQQQQQQQLALARSAAAAVAAGFSRSSMYGNIRNKNAADQLQCGSSTSTCSHEHQQQLSGLHAQQNMLAPAAWAQTRPGSVIQHETTTWSAEGTGVLGAGSAGSASQQQVLQDQNSNMSSSSRLAQAAAGASNIGRWVDGLVIVDSPAAMAPGSAGSAANTCGIGLECDEDLLSLETAGDAYLLPQQLRSSNAAAAVGPGQQHMVDHMSDSHGMCSPQSLQSFALDSGSSNNRARSCIIDGTMEDGRSAALAKTWRGALGDDPAALNPSLLVAAKSAAVAAQEAAAAKQAVALRMLGTTAQLRKGGPVLTATPSFAAAAGAESVRSRLLITEVSVYTEKGACSHLALDQANKLLSKMALPDGVMYMPVSPASFLFRAGAAWQFPAFVICLGSSYLQRMFARLPQLAEAALACPGFEDYCQYLPEQYLGKGRRYLSGPEATATLATLRSVQFTCLFIATKIADQVHALGLLRFMLTRLSHNGAIVSLEQAADVEARCLDALDWRLGPFFLEDDLTGDDEELWAESMGHWTYGSDRDQYPEAFGCS